MKSVYKNIKYEKKNRFPFIISDDLKKRLSEAKIAIGISMTSIITVAIIEYLDKRGL